jgi:hypothetical protein
MTHDPTRDCEHGRLKGKCDVCDLQAEVDMLKGAPVPTGPYSAPIKELWPVAPKTWVGLTDNEIALINADYPNPQGFARAIEAKLREKNGGEA